MEPLKLTDPDVWAAGSSGDAWFLHGLVRLMCPQVVVSSCGGQGAVALAAGMLRCDPPGQKVPRLLYIYQTDETAIERTESQLRTYLPHAFRYLRLVWADASAHDAPIADLVYLASQGPYRERELVHWLRHGAPLSDEGVVVVRDPETGAGGADSVPGMTYRYVYLPGTHRIGLWARAVGEVDVTCAR